MKTSIAIITALFFNLIAVAKTEEVESFPIVSYWSKGDVFNYTFTQLKTKISNGKVELKDSSVYHLRFEILDESDTSYTIKYTKVPSHIFLFSPSMLKENIDQLSEEIIYYTDEFGMLQGLKNPKQSINKINAKMTEFLETALQNTENGDKANLDKAKSSLNTMLNEENVISLMYKELTYFHFLYGYEFSSVEKISYEDVLPNPLGGDAILADAEISVSSFDLENTSCTLNHLMTIKPEVVNKFIYDVVEKMNRLNNTEEKTQLKDMDIQISDDNSFQMDYDYGLPINIHTNRTLNTKVKNEISVVKEESIIELIDLE